MSTLDIKKRLIKKIQDTDNEELLRDATRLMDIKLADDMPYVLTSEMNEVIDESLEQIKEGDFIEHSAANKEIEKWFDK